jgi:hypothetical protein
MLIFGWTVLFKTLDTGVFHCPCCGGDRQYRIQQARRWFTLFFIPLIPLGVVGEHVECTSCRTTFGSAVLRTPTQAPGAFPPHGQMPPPVSRGTNGFAIASLVTGIVFLFPLAAIFGLVALSQIKKSGAHGRGMAVAGLVLSAVGLFASIGFALGDRGSSPATAAAGADASRTSVAISQLKDGDCIESFPEGAIYTLTVVPCTQSHTGEALAHVTVPDAPTFPGNENVGAQVSQLCSDGVGPRLQRSTFATQVELSTIVPTAGSWESGDRSGLCFATTKNNSQLSSPIGY